MSCYNMGYITNDLYVMDVTQYNATSIGADMGQWCLM